MENPLFNAALEWFERCGKPTTHKKMRTRHGMATFRVVSHAGGILVHCKHDRQPFMDYVSIHIWPRDGDGRPFKVTARPPKNPGHVVQQIKAYLTQYAGLRPESV